MPTWPARPLVVLGWASARSLLRTSTCCESSPMSSEQRSVFNSQWVLDAQGAGGEPVPPSVLAEWQRFQRTAWSARRRHFVVEVSSLVVSATIPALAAFALDTRIVAAVGSLAVLVNGLRALGAFKEDWTSRTRARYAIEREIALFAVHHGKYTDPGAAVALVEAVEEICATEREGWTALRLAYGGPSEKPKTAPHAR